MSQGASLNEIMAFLNIAEKTLYRLMREEKEFFQSIKRGLRMSKGWWETNGRTNLQNKEFNSTLWYMNMKNRFGWKDKHDLTSNDKPIPFIVKLTDDRDNPPS